MHLRPRFLMCLLPLVGGCATAQLPLKPPGRYEQTLTVDGLARKYILRVPKSYTGAPTPVVYVLHGFTASAYLAEVYTGMADAAERAGFIAVFPDGSGRPQGWNTGFLNLAGRQTDDVKFLQSLMDEIGKQVNVDRRRVYVCGHSNGAMMAHLLGSKLSRQIAAIGAVAGTIGLTPQTAIKPPERPVSVMIIHGKLDATVAYGPGSQALLKCIGAEESGLWWAKEIGAKLPPAVISSGKITRTVYSGGRDATAVEVVSIGNGNHDWPGGISRTGRETVTGVVAADLLIDFFRAHPRP